jgi:hypothetical protein
MKLDWNASFVEILTLLVAVIGGVAGYILVQSHQADEARSNATLARMQQDLTQIEAKLGTVGLSVDISEFIADIQPNIQIELRPTFEVSDKTLTLMWELTNNGKHTLVVEDPKFSLSRTNVREVEYNESLLVEGTDFEMLVPSAIGEIAPGRTTRHEWIIRFKGKLPKRVFYVSQWPVRLDPAVQKIAKGTLVNYLDSADAINDLANKRIGRTGWLSL